MKIDANEMDFFVRYYTMKVTDSHAYDCNFFIRAETAVREQGDMEQWKP